MIVAYVYHPSCAVRYGFFLSTIGGTSVLFSQHSFPSISDRSTHYEICTRF